MFVTYSVNLDPPRITLGHDPRALHFAMATRRMTPFGLFSTLLQPKMLGYRVADSRPAMPGAVDNFHRRRSFASGMCSQPLAPIWEG